MDPPLPPPSPPSVQAVPDRNPRLRLISYKNEEMKTTCLVSKDNKYRE